MRVFKAVAKDLLAHDDEALERLVIEEELFEVLSDE